MIYDKANRLIMSQDGNQKSKQQWLVNKYDILGRLLYTSILNREITSSEKNYIYDNVIIESYIGGADKGFAETGYTCIHFASELDLLTANYYDNYNFFEIWPGTITTDLVYMDRNGYGTVYAAYPVFGNNESGCKGLQTGSLQRVLGTNSYLYQVDYYDYRGRVIQSRSTNHLGGYDHVYNQYDFSGNLTKTLKEHNVLGQQQITEAYTYTYDQALRLKTTKYKLNNNDTVLLTSNKYDKFGRLTEKKRHNNTDTEEFEYNPRGWTTKIKSGEFEENLYYNSPMPNNPTFSACYNGNIAASSWKYNGVINGYTYYYDNLNRLSSTYSVLNNEWADGLYTEYFSYDKQGNINNLQRWDNQDVSDILTLTYNGNRLKKVNDNGYSQNLYSIMEYRNLANLPTEFYYDANGNMTTDLDRNIVTIKYNLLNLPDTVQFANGNQIINQYDASGQKLYTRYYTVLYPEAVPVISTLEPGKTIKLEYNMDIVDETGVFYVNNYEYGFNGCDPGWYWIRRIHNPEGYFSQEPGTYQTFYYYRKDHLGNNREVWRASYTNGSTTYAAATEQKTQYYPSGLPWKSNSGDNPGSQPYKYGGKEFVEMHGLDEYDSDARWYYPAIMQTTTMDPLAEKYYDISPYAWCGNNPVKFVDPDGRRIYMVTGNKVVLASAKIMHQTDIGKTLWNKYNNSRTDDIYISSQKFKNVKAGGYTYANAQKYNIIKNGKITLDLNNPNQSDMSNINGLDVSKSEGKNIHIVNINEKTASTDGTYGDKKFDSGAYAMFHEIDAHIDKDGTYNSELGHKLHGYSLITTEIEGKKVQAIKIEKNSDAWKMIMQLIELNNKENE